MSLRRRILRRVGFGRLGLRRVGVWYHPSYRLPLSGILAATGMSARRADDALTWLMDQGLCDQPFDAPRAVWEDVERVHTIGWVEQLDQPEAVARVLGTTDTAALPIAELLETWRRATGGTVAATRWALRERRPAANLLGGFHHAFPDHGAGFCLVNDVAIAVARVRHEGFTGQIVILDLDAHPPDGIAACLEGDDGVVIGSLGVDSAWEAGPRVRDHRLPSGAGDAVTLQALDALLAELPTPELVFYLAGADPLAGDRFGGLQCTEAGLRERDRRVMQWVGRTPVVILPAGGYTEDAWRILAGTVAEASHSRARIPENYDPVRRRTYEIARTLDPAELQGNLGITEADVMGPFGGTAEDPRFLGYYTQHGIEYALERYGLLPALRRMGFSGLQVELSTRELPHRLRVTADVYGEREVLVDLSLSTRWFGTWRVLYVEWLELRDPRVRRRERCALPGQEAPGLGLAIEVGHVLLRCAQRLGLSGVGVVPSWYHVAWMGRRDFQAVDPEAQGRFEAIVEHLADVPLHEATARLASPGLPLKDGTLTWQPIEMVRPVDPSLKEALEAQRPQVEAARDRWLAALALARKAEA